MTAQFGRAPPHASLVQCFSVRVQRMIWKGAQLSSEKNVLNQKPSA
jgi:hypothetical protein